MMIENIWKTKNQNKILEEPKIYLTYKILYAI